jgi:hypothetical protein
MISDRESQPTLQPAVDGWAWGGSTGEATLHSAEMGKDDYNPERRFRDIRRLAKTRMWTRG